MKTAPALPLPADIRWMNLASLALFGVFGLALLAALGAWALRHPSIVLRGITVTGDVTHNNAVTLRANVAPRLRGNFFTVDLAQARAAFESVPWVRTAVVRRDFPGGLRVDLQEHRAVALWGGDGDTRLVNHFGEVFDANLGDVEQDNLPRLGAPQPSQAKAVLAMYEQVTPVFARLDLAVSELVQTPGGSWRATLESGAVIELGRGTPAELLARLDRFVTTLTQVASRYGRRADMVESADLRHPTGYALRMRGVSTVADNARGPIQR